MVALSTIVVLRTSRGVTTFTKTRHIFFGDVEGHRAVAGRHRP